MDEKRIATLLRRAADEVPDVPAEKIMQAIRSPGRQRRKWAGSLAAAALAAMLILAAKLGPGALSPPAAPQESETVYMLVRPAGSPYPDPLSLGDIVVPADH